MTMPKRIWAASGAWNINDRAAEAGYWDNDPRPDGATPYVRDDPFALAAALRTHGFIVPRITLADGTTEPDGEG